MKGYAAAAGRGFVRKVTKKAGKEVHAEIMVPVTCDVRELDFTKKVFDKVYETVNWYTQPGREYGLALRWRPVAR